MNKYFYNIVVNTLKTSRSPATDEYETECNIDFILLEPLGITLFGVQHDIVAVCLRNKDYYDEELMLCLTEQTGERCNDIFGFDIPQDVIQSVFDMLKEEEEKPNQGVLKRHILSDDTLFDNCTIYEDE